MGSYHDFLISYGKELKDVVYDFNTALKKLYIKSTGWSDIQFESLDEELVQELKNYDREVAEYIIDHIQNMDKMDIENVAEKALRNQNNNGTEPHFMLEAIHYATNIINRSVK